MAKFPSTIVASKKTFIDESNMRKYLSGHLANANEVAAARLKAGEKDPIFESVYFSLADIKAILEMDEQGITAHAGIFFSLKSIENEGVDFVTLIGVGVSENGELVTDALTCDNFVCPPNCSTPKK